MKTLSFEDLDHLALGAAVLGSGGGGSPAYCHMITQHMIETHGPVHIREVASLCPDDLVLPVAFMGAPLVGLEKIASGKELPALLEAFERHMGRRPTVIMPAEIGGSNAFTPLWAGAMLGIPVLDADIIGRAFPELQMSSCALKGISASPAFLADCLGNTAILNGLNGHTIERLARHVTMAMGSCAAVALHPMDGVTAAKTVVEGSLSKAISIGRVLAQAGLAKRNPAQEIAQATQGAVLGSGTLIDIDQKVEGGFLKGKALIRCLDGKMVSLCYQNEYLLAMCDDRPLASTPDILILLEQETGTPVLSETLRYGLRVDLMALPAPDVWCSKAGLDCVGPGYFGYEIAYTPIKRGHT